jgi:hypothetical protein
VCRIPARDHASVRHVVQLTGLGRALPDLRLEQRSPERPVGRERDVEIDDNGSFSVAVKAATPEEFRVTSGTIATPSTKPSLRPAWR